MARTVWAMKWGRFRRIEYLHAGGLKAWGGRPPRIPGWLRREVVGEAEKELAGLDLEAILTADPPFEENSDAELLAHLDQFGVAMLIDVLRPSVGSKNRNRSAISLAWRVSQVRQLRIKRGDKQRTQLDKLIEDVAAS
jgi:hypothetical protein